MPRERISKKRVERKGEEREKLAKERETREYRIFKEFQTGGSSSIIEDHHLQSIKGIQAVNKEQDVVESEVEEVSRITRHFILSNSHLVDEEIMHGPLH